MLAAPPPALAANATQYTLDNGMMIVVVPDRRAPVVTHMVWYRVGGIDDPPGLSGVAHFFEHLMFKGTDKTPPGELSRIIARNGGQDNAFTSHDYTAYFQRIASDRLRLMMELEADRMVNLNLSEENVATEREVVREERRLRTDSNPTARAQEQIYAALYLSHPYGRPVVGWDEEIQNIGREEAIRFYNTHYAPNNATLIVVGDVDPEEVLALAREIYGPIPARELEPRAPLENPPRLAETRIDIEDPDLRLPALMRVYRVPSYGNGDAGVAESLNVMTTILGGGATSRLYRELVVERQLAVSAGAWYSGTARDAADLGVYAYPRDGVSFDELEAAMDEIIDGMKTATPEPGEFTRVKTRLIAAYTYAQDSQYLQSRDYGTALSIGLTVEDVEEWPNRIEAVTPENVQQAAQDYLIRKEAVTGRLSPAAL
ncbi:MAG: insulinase family protein [Proteobacteria bacterium]|nr:insulinase family protein [Pseudomonadota bacterium]